MISFWTPRDNNSIHAYRSNRGLLIADQFAPRVYEELTDPTGISTGPHIFAALDQLSAVQHRAVGQLWDEHASHMPGGMRLNDPRRVLLRFELLRRLKIEGLNAFNVYRHDEIDAIDRFPVFVREIHRHSGPKTKLLYSPQQVRNAIMALRIRGRRRDSLMIVEYADASGADGLFRKYAAFRVGSRIIACHVFASPDWCVKSHQNQLSELGLQQDLDFVRGNPHRTWLERVFEVAGIEYGRIDYGISNGEPQAWEINLNPTIGREPGRSRHTNLLPQLKAVRDGTRELFHDQLRAAFLALDDGSTGNVSVSLGKRLMADLDADRARQMRAVRIKRWANALYESPTLGGPVRKAYSLFPRR